MTSLYRVVISPSAGDTIDLNDLDWSHLGDQAEGHEPQLHEVLPDGVIVPSHHWALLADDEIVPLFPRFHWIWDYGTTSTIASLRGRLLYVEPRLCMACGHVYSAPRVALDQMVGFLPGLLVGAGLALYLGETLWDGVMLAVSAGLVGAMFGVVLHLTYGRLALSRQAAAGRATHVSRVRRRVEPGRQRSRWQEVVARERSSRSGAEMRHHLKQLLHRDLTDGPAELRA